MLFKKLNFDFLDTVGSFDLTIISFFKLGKSMGKLVLFSLLALLIVHSQAQSNYAVYAFSWYEGHCQNIARSGGCDPEKVALWDHQSFTIHGLWPATKATKNYGEFDYSILEDDQELLDDMNNYWPPKSRYDGSETFLWEHEWTDHGHDYAELIHELQPHRFSDAGIHLNRKLQHAFFLDVVAFYKHYKAAIRYPDATLTKETFARHFGITAADLTLSCVRANVLREIKVCFELTSSEPRIVKCKSTSNTGCSNKFKDFILPEWALSKQSRVIAIPSE